MKVKKYSLLVVDDVSMEREGIKFLIEKNALDFHIFTAASGQEACDILDIHPIDVLLTDVEMPLMDGFAVCTYAKEHHPKIKIIIFSAHSDFAYAKQAIHFKVDDYLLKPIYQADFLKLMHKTLDQLAQEEIIQQSKQEAESPLWGGIHHNVAQALELIHNHYCEDLSIDWYAGQVNLSAGYLCEIFKDEVGQNFTHYIADLRMAKAKEFLRQTSLKVFDISQAVGYANVSYFGFLFKKFTGVSPGEYRRIGMQDTKETASTEETL